MREECRDLVLGHPAGCDFLAERGAIALDLQADLDRLATRKIPVDVVFEQGPAVLGLEQ